MRATTCWSLLMLALTLGGHPVSQVRAQPASPVRRVKLTLPEGWKQAPSMQLVLTELRTPANRAAVIRITVDAEGGPSLGSIGSPGQSPRAKGETVRETVTMDVTKALRQWVESHPGDEVPVLLEPYAGLKKLDDFPWSFKELKFVPGKP